MPIPSSVGTAFNADTLQNLDISLNREWLVTNGIGGFASASLAGANTRRYHGLLVLRRPLRWTIRIFLTLLAALFVTATAVRWRR